MSFAFAEKGSRVLREWNEVRALDRARLQRKAAGFPGMSRSLSLTDPSGWEDYGTATAAGKYVDDDSALQLPTVWACTRVLAETISTLPSGVFERDAQGNMTRLDDHDLTQVLVESPNADQTDTEFKEQKVTNLAGRGNAYSIIERSTRRVTSLTPVESCNVSVKRNNGGELRYVINDRGKPEEYPQDRVWHWKTFSKNGITGLSPIGYLRESMGFSLGLQEFGSRMFANGLHTSRVIKYPSWMTDEQRAKAETKLARLYSGLHNAGNPLILEGGMEQEDGIMSFVDAQFLQLIGAGVLDICRIYRIPPHMVADLSRATFSNIEQQSLDFVMYTILPYLTRIERSVSKWLVSPGERGRVFFKFNVEGLLRADSAGRASLYSILLQNGVLTRNEVRALENRNKLTDEGMDSTTVQSNMISVEDLQAVANAARQRPAVPEV